MSEFNEKLTERANSLIEKARAYADKDNAAVGTRYLLLAILSDTESFASQYMKTAGFTIRDIKRMFSELEVDKASAGTLTPEFKAAFGRAKDEAEQLGAELVDTDHVMLALLPSKKSTVMDKDDFSQLMEKLAIQPTNFRNYLLKNLAKGGEEDALFATPTLSEFATNLVTLAQKGLLDPVVGREDLVERLMLVLGQRQQANAVLLGEPGVGKQSVINRLAQRIADGSVPEQFKGKRVEVLDINLMVAGSKYRGEFEDRMKALTKEVKDAGNVILVIPKLEIVGVGQIGDSAADAASILSPELKAGTIRIIGTATVDEYRENVEKDQSVSGLFDSIMVEEPAPELAVQMIEAIAPRYEDYHGVKYTQAAILAAVKQANRYLSERVLPDSARFLLDFAGSRAKLDKAEGSTPVVDVTEINSALALTTGIPVGTLSETDAERLLKMPQYLHERVIGQDEAVKAVSAAFQRNGAGLGNPRGPIASFIFSGTTGVGKTELARALNDLMFPGQEMVRLDMSEFMEKHTASRLVGAPPGYVGYGKGGELTEPVRKRPYSLVLLDEVEKAHEDVILILLQVLEDGRLTDSNGRVVDFKNTVVIMTTNIGADKLGAKKAGGVGITLNRGESAAHKAQTHDVLAAIEKYFKPEFLNRVDEKIVFEQLTKDHVKEILALLLKVVRGQLGERGLDLVLSEAAIDFMVEAGYEPKYGARPLNRAIIKHIKNPLSLSVLGGNFKGGDTIEAVVEDGELVFRPMKKV